MAAFPVRTAAAILIAGGAATALVAAACSSSYGSADTPDADVKVTVGADASDPGVVDPCTHALPPPMPATDDAPAVNLPAFVMALGDDVFKASSIPGFDIDGVCTCDTRPGTAQGGAESCLRPKGGEVQCDLPNGVDNSVANLFVTFSAFVDVFEKARAQIRRGMTNALIQVVEYNGEANDKDVTIGLLQSDGIKTKGCPSSVYEAEKAIWSPGWCGDDAWSVRPESVIGNNVAPAIVGRGYVTNHELVVRINGTPRLPFSESTSIGFADPILYGKLVPLGEDLKPRDPARPPTEREKRLWALEGGVLTGRLTMREVLAAVGSTRMSGDGGTSYLCQQPVFDTVKAAVCGAADLPRTKALDFDPSAVCDAMSAGMPFSAKPALLGPVATGTNDSRPCDPGPDGEPLEAGVSYTCP